MEKIKCIVTLNVILHSDHILNLFLLMIMYTHFNLNIPLMQDISINTLDEYKTVTKLSNENTIRPDNIPLLFIKNLASSICLLLAFMFQNSINKSKLPSIWKVAHVIPIFNGDGSKYSVTNYKPISLCAILSKILVSIIKIIGAFQ